MGIEQRESIFSNAVYPDETSHYRENTIYIILGMECNLNCIYCLNKDNRNTKALPKRISPLFKKYLCDVLPKSLGQEKRLLQFWGGEPLLYFEQIKEITTLIKDIPNYEKLIVTNGTLLNDEIIDFLNEHEIRLSVSHDGPFCKQSRGVNILEDPDIVRLIHKSQFFVGFSAVITPECSSFYRIDDYFSSIMKPTHSMFNLLHCHDTGGIFTFGEQLDNDMKEFTDNVKQKALNGTLIQSKEMHWLTRGFYTYLFFHQNRSVFENNLFFIYANIDLDGNVYLDHDARWVIGTVDMDLQEYISKALALFSENIIQPEGCKECVSHPICKGGVILPAKNKPVFCENLQKFWNPIIRMLEEEFIV